MAILSFLTLRYKNCSLHVKLFASYFLLIFIPVITLAFFFGWKSTRIITNQSMEISRLYLEEAEAAVSAEFSKLSMISSQLAQSAEVHKVLEKQGTDIRFGEEYDDMNDLYETISNTCSLQSLYQIRLYISDSFRHSRREWVTYPLSSIAETGWYRQLVEEHEIQALVPPQAFKVPLAEPQELLSIVTLIRSTRDFNRILGVASADIPKDDLVAMLSRSSYTETGAVYLVDDGLNIICGSADKAAFAEADSLLSEAAARFGRESGVFAENDLVAGLSAPVYGGWRVFTVASFDQLLTPTTELRDQMLLVTVLVSIIAFTLSYFYSRYSTRRIKALAGQVQRVESGDLTVACVVDSEDEIGELQSSFNFMVRRLKLLVDERYNLGKSLRDMELRALQAQINPHFLYNTLDLISWKAKASRNDEIVDIVVKLAHFYRLSLSNGSDFLPLCDEVEHIRLFIDLNNLCCGRSVRLEADVAPEIADYPIMKLILQPIVENSLFHGLFDLESREGVIRLTARLDDGSLQIQIADNGVGIDRAKLADLSSCTARPAPKSRSGGYGIANVIERLKVYYSDDYTFDIGSAVMGGTTVTIRLPYDRGSSPQIRAERFSRPEN